jgi:hypothetical protein
MILGQVPVGPQFIQPGEGEQVVVVVQEVRGLPVLAAFPFVVAVGGHQAAEPGGGGLERGFLGDGLAAGGDQPAEFDLFRPRRDQGTKRSPRAGRWPSSGVSSTSSALGVEGVGGAVASLDLGLPWPFS